MGKKVYVNGAIFVNTPLFSCPDAGCLYSVIPEDSTIIEPNSNIEGSPCLVIDDENPQSIFNSYYAKSWFSSNYRGSSYLIDRIEDIYQEYQSRLHEIQELFNTFPQMQDNLRYAFYKMLYLSAISSIDTFICSVILNKMAHDESCFMSCADFLCTKKTNSCPVKIGNPRWEQKVIEQVLCVSFCNEKRILQTFEKCGINLSLSELDPMSQHFKNRHVLVHRNGKKIDGSYLELSGNEIIQVLSDCNSFADRIRKRLRN